MPSVEDRYYKAIKEEDQRFDGLFFSGILTTGVYCRTVCPVPNPAKRENVRFYASAAGAEKDGFRPCRRCHPERATETPVWGPYPPIVSRALTLIFNGVLDREGLDAMASRLGLGSRQLRRLFNDYLGAPPLAVAKARRVHFARRLIDQTDMSMIEIALAAGFRSVRQFNHDFRKTFGLAPSDIRRSAKAKRPDGGWISLQLPYRPPLDWPRMIKFMQARAIPGIEVVGHDRYRRAIDVNGDSGEIEIVLVRDDPQLVLRVRAASSVTLCDITHKARQLFDLDADPIKIATDLRRSKSMGPLVRSRPGLRIPHAWDRFELAVRAVLGQQISVRAASRLAERLVQTFGRPANGLGDGLTHLFPPADTLAEADLAAIGATRAQARSIRAMAGAIASREFALDASRGLDVFIEEFCELPGIGPWTANYVAMRALGEPDAFPVGDLGLQRAAGNGKQLSAAELAEVAEEWRPWRAYAAMYLWASESASRPRGNKAK